MSEETEIRAFPVAVVMERRTLENPWVDEAWEAVGVIPAFGALNEAGVKQLVMEPEHQQWLHAGFALELFRDEAENYFLNLAAAMPKVFVMWRYSEEQAVPVAVTVSYGEAARLMDSGEQVDGVVMSQEIADWVGAFVNKHYRPAPRKKIRRNDPLAQRKNIT